MGTLRTLRISSPSAALILACLSLSTGCELGQNISGLTDAFVNPNPEGISGEGQRIVEGSFASARFTGNPVDGEFIIALEDTDPGGAEDPLELVMVGYPDGDKCSLGPTTSGGTRFQSPVARPGQEAKAGEALTPYLSHEDKNEAKELRFADFKCKSKPIAISNASLPLSSSFSEDPGFIVQTGDGKLHWVDPWNEEQKEVAQGAQKISDSKRAIFAAGAEGTWMWTVEDGEIVARDKRLQERARLGSKVTSLRHIQGSSQGAVIAFKDESNTLFTALASALEKATEVAKDVCEDRLVSGQRGPELHYYAPCADRTLHIRELNSGKVHEVGTGITRYKMVGMRESGPIALFITERAADAGKSSVGRLWAKFGAEPALKLGDRGHISLTHLSDDGRILALLEWDQHGGTLYQGRLGEELEEKAKGVAYRRSYAVVFDFDGSTGTLGQFNEDGDLEPLLEEVSIRGILRHSDKRQTLVISDYDGLEGKLKLISNDKVDHVDAHVRPGAYEFTTQLDTVTLLANQPEDAATATLKIKPIGVEDITVISEGVSETLEVGWPRPGLLYTVPAGPRSGVWFTRAN